MSPTKTQPSKSRIRNLKSPIKPRSLPVLVGNLLIGGGAPVRVQSMTKTRTEDVNATLRQIRQLTNAGCELIRLAVPDEKAADALKEIRQGTSLPLIADIHFNYRFALQAIEAGFDKIRINPGNIGANWKVAEIIKAASDKGVAIRVGVNSGSIPKTILKSHRHPTIPAMLEAMAQALVPFEKLNFKALVLSAKTTVVEDLIAVNEEFSRRYPYPIHLGLTEAGPPFEGVIRSTAALTPLLRQGIGDTIRISLTGNPVLEVIAGYELLASLGLRFRAPMVYSCPGCGRTQINLEKLVRKVKKALKGIAKPLKIAVMGCVVNGPGEAREADFGIAWGGKKGAVFARGKVIKTCKEERLLEALLTEINREIK
ncbi:MAG: flavodoxin-dependent (E)-4-hydroxy-3-methylbut-2-enyl-diphosphate synthase [candidate division WOR-3 bacterium]